MTYPDPFTFHKTTLSTTIMKHLSDITCTKVKMIRREMIPVNRVLVKRLKMSVLFHNTSNRKLKWVDLLLSEEVNCVQDWFALNELTNNPEKWEPMWFGSVRPDKIKIGVSELNYETPCRYLEIHMDKRLPFREHIDYIVRTKWTLALHTESVEIIQENIYWCFITLKLHQLSAMVWSFMEGQREPTCKNWMSRQNNTQNTRAKTWIQRSIY